MNNSQPKLWSKAGWTGQGRKFFLQTPKSKIEKKHLYAIFPFLNNNHIFYDYRFIMLDKGMKSILKFGQR
jgi:hypothetical protein